MTNQDYVKMQHTKTNESNKLFKYSSFKFEIINHQSEKVTKGENIIQNNSISRYPLQIIHSQDLNENEERNLSNDKIMTCHFFPCMKTFKSRENLDLHILNIHLKIKPFKCKFCERKFSHRNGKIYHERTKHLNYLPFSCLDCIKKFASKTALKVHAKSKHFLSMSLALF